MDKGQADELQQVAGRQEIQRLKRTGLPVMRLNPHAKKQASGLFTLRCKAV